VYDVTLDSRSGLAIELNRADAVTGLNQGFLKALKQVRNRVRQSGSVTLQPEHLQAFSQEMIDVGGEAFNETFPPGTPIRQTITKDFGKRREHDLLLALTIRSSSVDHFPLMWEMLCDAENADYSPANYWGVQDLWGFQFAIARETWSRARPVIDPYMRSLGDRSGMLMLTYDKLKNVKEVEIPGLMEQLQGYGVPCQLVNQMLVKTGTLGASDVLTTIIGAEPGFDFLHFACHAQTDAKNTSNSRLRLTVHEQDLTIEYRDLSRRSERWLSHPLVFLNACASGEQPEFQSRSLVRLLLDRGARGIIVTECVMPDVFAARFALTFYEHLFSGLHVDHALLMTRLHFLKEHNNPLGLAYTLYAHPDTQVV
jgi:hypothetical protein